MLHVSFPTDSEIKHLKDRRRPIDISIPSGTTVPTNIRTLHQFTSGPGSQPVTFWKGSVEIELYPAHEGKVTFWIERAPRRELHVDHAHTESHWISLRDSLGRDLKITEHILAIVGASRIAFDMSFCGTPTAPTLANCVQDYVNAIFEWNITDTPWNVPYVTVNHPVLYQQGKSYMLLEPPDKENPQLTLDLSVDYATPWMVQRIMADADDNLLKKIAGARTGAFGLRSFLLHLNQIPLIWNTVGRKFRQLSPQNVVSLNNRGIHNPRAEFDVLSEATGLLLNSELVYHELLDKLGALALLHPSHFLGKITMHRTSHAFDVLVMKKLQNWEMLSSI